MRYYTAQGKRTLADRSKYKPHQNAKECMRRVGQILRGQLNVPRMLVDELTEAAYIDYATTKAAGGDLSRFSRATPVPAQPTDSVLDKITDDYDGLMDVTIVPEEGNGAT